MEQQQEGATPSPRSNINLKHQPQNNMTMDATTSNYLSDHYMAAARWARAIEGSKRVKSIETYERYAVVRIDGERILRMDELMKLAKLCKASGLEYVIGHGTTDLMILIDKA